MTAYTALTGIPVSHTVTAQPGWAAVTISPASDIFPVPPAAGGTAIVVSRAFTVVVTLAQAPADDVSDIIEVTGETSPGTPFGMVFTGRAAAPVTYVAPEDPCLEGLTSADWQALAVEAADAYNEHHASAAESPRGDEVSVQTGGAAPVAMPWLVVGGFAALGAGVGLALRRRLR